MKLLKSTKGFTLIELVMVIVILGILAAVAVPKFGDLADRANVGVFNGDVSSVQSGINMYQASQLMMSGGLTAGARGFPIDLDGATNGATTGLFDNVLEEGINDRWSKGGAALSSMPDSVTYTFTNIDPDTTVQYNNSTGRIR